MKYTNVIPNDSVDAFYHPPVFPYAWADSWGEDEYGLWQVLKIRAVEQCFRWIAPGSFLMGSPETEVERQSDEQHHEVVLTTGFWLADTACTQALWLEVMASNPSYFKNARNWHELPVEQVSWNDCQNFLQKLNQHIADVQCCLPTEAQWEYACRAGEHKYPFAFGRDLNTELANYHGNHPYHNGKKERYRKKTVPVKDLYRNSWGLYQMHGNVWEWCQDWYAKQYDMQQTTNSQGAAEGEYRVLRGGSLINHGHSLRSAQRNYDVPSFGWRNNSFRIALVNSCLMPVLLRL